MARRTLLLALITAFIATSCRKPSGASWDVDVVVPVVNSRMNISNFIADTIFRADAGGLLHFRFNRQLASLKLDSLLAVPDTVIQQPFTFSLQLTVQPGVPLNYFPPEDLVFAIGGGIEITRIDLRKGKLKVKFSNTLDETIRLDYEVTSATRNGQVFRIAEDIPPGGSIVNREYDLSGYRFSMRGMNNNRYNRITQGYTVTVISDKSQVTVPANTGAHAELS